MAGEDRVDELAGRFCATLEKDDSREELLRILGEVNTDGAANGSGDRETATDSRRGLLCALGDDMADIAGNGGGMGVNTADSRRELLWVTGAVITEKRLPTVRIAVISDSVVASERGREDDRGGVSSEGSAL